MHTKVEEHISGAQYGFRQNRSTADGIFIVKTVIEKYGEPLIAVYVDLTAAYDHIPRDFLFRVLRIRTGATHDLVALLQKLYEGTTVLVVDKVNKNPPSCLSVNYYFDYVLKVAAAAIKEAFPDGWGNGLEFNVPYTCVLTGSNVVVGGCVVWS